MKDAQKPNHASLNVIINRLSDGRFVIPDFQREFEWKPWDIRDLMRSIFLDYYIGSLLLWKGRDRSFTDLACEPIYGYRGEGSPDHIVLDGQQRLTAMYYTFKAPDVSAPGRANRFLYYIRINEFMMGDFDEAFDYDWTKKSEKLLTRDYEAQYAQHLFPLRVVGKSGFALANWVQGYERYWRKRAEEASEKGLTNEAEEAKSWADYAVTFGEHLKGITEEYQIAYIELDSDLELDKVCDIFTQINSRGVRLDIFDLMNALLKPKGLQLKHMWRSAQPRLEFAESQRMNVYVLQVMSILKQSYCSPKYLYYLLPGHEKTVRNRDGSLRKQVLVEDEREFNELWRKAVDALDRAIELLRHPQEYGAISPRYLPYVSILPAFAALQVAARTLPANRQLEASRKIRQWYWASIFTNRYSGSVESTTARDYLDVKAWFDENAAEPGLISEFRSQFRTLDLKRETKRGTSIYNGIFNLLVLRGARDWMTGNVPSYQDLDDHHIIPKEWGQQHNLGNLVDSVLNRTPLTTETNRKVIRNRLPNEYIPELIEENEEATVRAILESHFISPIAFDILLRNPFSLDDFEDFLDERKRTIFEAIEDMIIKNRLDLSPQLKELDAHIEQIELDLRELIDNILDDSVERLPSHVKDKAEQRIRTALRKNPGLDADHYCTLAGHLEYCDLRDLEAIINNTSLWPSFHRWFQNKEMLVNRFAQLGELRNSIRHSRSADEITQKDGEAAIKWFSDALNR